ncbi:MAG: phosphoribosylamine--glycine ligase [Dehalococcoidia bacterium]
MKVLIIGSGGREHAIAWAIRKTNSENLKIYVAPGNAGTLPFATNVNIQITEIVELATFAKENNIDLTIVGSEIPLALGIVDIFTMNNLKIFGPSKNASQIESSKEFAKTIMKNASVPTADSIAFDSYEESIKFLTGKTPPFVIKANGLAAGKGVIIAASHEEAYEALDNCLNKEIFGESGKTVLIEEFLEGKELSIFAFTDGNYVSPLIGACDYKRIYDNDLGPNTGGMGGYSPPYTFTSSLNQEINSTIITPTIHEMAKNNTPFTGILYGGLILTNEGPKVIEYNCRFGDPEAEILLPLLDSNLFEICQAGAENSLNHSEIRWSTNASVGIVLTSEGYPNEYETDKIISIGNIQNNCTIFHNGTKIDNENNLISSGGRVLTIVSTNTTVENARIDAYDAIKSVKFSNSHYRNDIAKKSDR